MGTIGASYGAFVQWQTAVLRPPHLAAMVVSGSPMERIAFENGVFSLSNWAAWLHIVYHQKPEDESPLDAMKTFKTDFSILPVIDQDLKAFGRMDEVWRRWCMEDSDSGYWQPMGLLGKLDRITVPVLHQSGWFDSGGNLATKLNYLVLSKAGAKNQRMIMGPWEHQDYASRTARGRDFGAEALIDLEQEFEQWHACDTSIVLVQEIVIRMRQV